VSFATADARADQRGVLGMLRTTRARRRAAGAGALVAPATIDR
jgi:hypothetical protein